MSAEIAGYYTDLVAKRQANVNKIQVDVGVHELHHAEALDRRFSRVDANPQGGPVLGVTEPAVTNYIELGIGAAGSHGLDGTGHDEGIIDTAVIFTGVSRGTFISAARARTSRIPYETYERASEVMIHEHGGVIASASQLSGIYEQVNFEQKQIVKEKKGARHRESFKEEPKFNGSIIIDNPGSDEAADKDKKRLEEIRKELATMTDMAAKPITSERNN